MYSIDFNKPIAIHFMGIGGISMSGLAEILLDRGFKVSGSDNNPSALIDKLESLGAKIYIPQAAENVSEDIDVVVYTAAIHPDNPEFKKCKELELPMMTRAELLGQIMTHYDNSVSVAGTHGKTTTTGMVGEIFLHGKDDPTISIGGIFSSIGGNIHVGDSDLFVTEACEYTNSFFDFHAKYNIILNIEEDHMDFFKDIDDIRHSFRIFAEHTPDDGALIINSAIDNYEEISRDLNCKVVTFGTDKTSDYYPDNISHTSEGKTKFTPMEKQPDGSYSALPEVTLSVPGEHNIVNSLSTIALSRLMGIEMEQVVSALYDFTGTDRRFQYKGKFNGAEIYDDYAHHPTEIAASLAAARTLPHERLIVVFQPHTYTRTKAFLQEFADELSEADVLILAPIYAAREKDEYGVHSIDIKKLVDAKNLQGFGDLERCYCFDTFDDIQKFLEKISSTGDLLITMGAGDVVKIGDSILSK